MAEWSPACRPQFYQRSPVRSKRKYLREVPLYMQFMLDDLRSHTARHVLMFPPGRNLSSGSHRPLKAPLTWSETAQIVQIPEQPNPKGPSRLGFAVLLGAGLLLVATWHKLTSRYYDRAGN